MSHVILEALLTLLKHKRENLQIFVALLKYSGKKTVSNLFFFFFSTYRNFNKLYQHTVTNLQFPFPLLDRSSL